MINEPTSNKPLIIILHHFIKKYYYCYDYFDGIVITGDVAIINTIFIAIVFV